MIVLRNVLLSINGACFLLLLYKLFNNANIQGKAWGWLRCFLSNRMFRRRARVNAASFALDLLEVTDACSRSGTEICCRTTRNNFAEIEPPRAVRPSTKRRGVSIATIGTPNTAGPGRSCRLGRAHGWDRRGT